MIKADIDSNINGKSLITMKGTLVDLMSEVSFLLTEMYTQIYAKDEKSAQLFRGYLTDEDGIGKHFDEVLGLKNDDDDEKLINDTIQKIDSLIASLETIRKKKEEQDK